MSATTSTPATTDARVVEFDRQFQVMLDRSFPALAGITESEFRAIVAPLRGRLADIPGPSSDRSLPFVVVISRDLVPTEAAMNKVLDSRGKAGVVNMDPVSPNDFNPAEGVDLPAGPAYLLVDVDLGAEFLDVRPRDARPAIERSGRLTLTIDEGVAVITQYSDALQTHNAFQLLASRQDSQRIPSIWRSYNQPRLGWCWDGAPHPWMGSASAAARLS